MIEHCEDTDLYSQVAGARDREQGLAPLSPAGGSIAVHERAGFDHVGTLRSVGFKHGRWLDTVLMQRALADGDSTAP